MAFGLYSHPFIMISLQIDLPPYKDYSTLEQKLTLAVEETVGFGCVPFPIRLHHHADL